MESSAIAFEKLKRRHTMKTYFVIIGVAVVLIVLLGGVAVRQNSQLSSTTDLLSAEKAHNTILQNKITSLEQEVATLKETADYYFQNGVNLQAAGNLQEAKTAFEAVVGKFPTSNLVGSAKERLTAVNEAIAKAEADRLAEAQRQQAEQEKLTREEGEPIDYSLFYAKAKSTGLPIGKRFRFEAEIRHDLHLAEAYGGSPSIVKELWGAVAEFDDESQHEHFLQGPDYQTRTVASMGADGNIKIHRIE
jgi:cell division protein FtsB